MGGVVGGVVVVGMIVMAALCKTGHLKFHKGGRSSGEAAARVDGFGSTGTQYPVAGPSHVGTGAQYPVPGSSHRGTHYPSVVQYPQPA